MSEAVAKKKPVFDFDPDKLREKYRAERDRRLRPDGIEQYNEVKGTFAHFVEDPYVEPGYTRAPIKDDMEVIVVGGGFGGLLAAARLREAGVKDIRIIDKAGDFGGTWYWNRYPGAACDVEAYIYLPLLEETGYMPPRRFARGNEIYEHARRIGKYFDLYRDACFQTELKEMRWDEGRARWVITTNFGDEMTARFVVMSQGPLNRPKLPGIPGITTFKGHMFHTSRWDYDYTGGSPDNTLTNLGDKRVAIVGTGATSVQVTPALAGVAKHLYVFQRTPSSIDVRGDKPTDPDWAKSLAPGWQRRRMENFDRIIAGYPQEENMVGDGWTEIYTTVFSLAKNDGSGNSAMDAEELRQMADFKKMEQVRARVDTIVGNSATAEALKPWYNQLCKRPCFHDEFLNAFNRDDVTLVDTHGHGVERITETSIVANGKEYPVDCIIFATGFEFTTAYTRRGSFEAYGRDGTTLTEKWANGPRSLHGIMARNFPNYFLVGGAQSSITNNIPFLHGEQARHIAAIVKRCLDRQIRAIDVTEEAEEGWQQEMKAKAIARGSYFEECTPGNFNMEGKGSRFFDGLYGGGPFNYMDIIRGWLDEGFDRDLEFIQEQPKDDRHDG